MKSLDVLIRLHRFQSEEKQRMIQSIEALIADTEEKAASLLATVEKEQERTGIEDISHFAFPMYAKTAHMRRENLLKTAEDLRQQAEDARMELSDTHAQVKKFESLRDSRDDAVKRQLGKRTQSRLDEAAAAMDQQNSA